MKANKEDIILDMIIELERGTTRKDCLAKNGEEWRISPRTFDRYWKTAQERHTQAVQSRQQQVTDLITESKIETIKTALEDKEAHALELLEYIKQLEKIKAGKTIQVGQGENMMMISATHADEIRAIAEIRAIKKQIGDWFGFNAPQKVDITKKVLKATLNLS